MDAFILTSLIAVLALLAYGLVILTRQAPHKVELQSRLEEQQEELARLREELARLRAREPDLAAAQAQIENLNTERLQLREERSRLQTQIEHERRESGEKLKLLEDAEKRLKEQFENLANRIFEDKGKTLTADNQQRLGTLLKPFQEQMEAFRKRVDEIHTHETAQNASLRKEVQNLASMSERVREDAENLARAIKGDAKVQGDWGEVIVERIFEASGLVRGEGYISQGGLRDEDGKLYKPDFVVNLPEDKAVIVDSKVSLTAYERYCNTEDEGERATALQAHLNSVRAHVKELADKDYTNLLGNRTLDFVIMCIPLEGAYQEALRSDKKLLYDMAATRVVITGPTTLMITLKLIAQIWRRDKEGRNAAAIADSASKLYGQVALVVESMLDSQKKLEQVNQSFETAIKRLKSGRGNLVGRIDSLRKLGVKANRQIPAEVLNEALDTEDAELIDGEDAAADVDSGAAPALPDSDRTS